LVSSNRSGEIVLLDFPYTNARGSKVKPAVIIFDNVATGKGSDLTVAYMTTEVDRYALNSHSVMLEAKDLAQAHGHLKKTSVRSEP